MSAQLFSWGIVGGAERVLKKSGYLCALKGLYLDGLGHWFYWFFF